ncbi:hypothetical protein SNEBB_000825 [Seison nebaliae]|nr:hypothetical protein SNEBB_000825 [Seison nebaliae]
MIFSNYTIYLFFLLIQTITIILVNGNNGFDLKTCQRIPAKFRNVKHSGDNGFYLKLLDENKYFELGATYTLSLNAPKIYNEDIVISIQQFAVVAVPDNYHPTTSIKPGSAMGNFYIINDDIAKRHPICPNLILHRNKNAKRTISLIWKAPDREHLKSNCVRIQATVVQGYHIWFMDDGRLTMKLCLKDSPEYKQLQLERRQKAEKKRKAKRCCACGEAKYTLTFHGLWSKMTHAKDYPEIEQAIHWSPLIGAVHSPEYEIWSEGNLASSGLKAVAMYGMSRTLENEFRNHSRFGQIRKIVFADGLWWPRHNGRTSFDFVTVKNYPYLSFVSMFGPSPDWISGLSNFDLCLSNCTWIKNAIVDLYPYDAGVDSGVSYMSEDSPTLPQEPISRITGNNPNNVQSPFHNAGGDEILPVARVHIERQILRGAHCPNSGSPAKPIRLRSRRVMNKGRYKGGMLSVARHNYTRKIKSSEHCKTTNWSEWSVCSVSCGTGKQVRTRQFINRNSSPLRRRDIGSNRCIQRLREYRACVGVHESCISEMSLEKKCMLTSWSSWSICLPDNEVKDQLNKRKENIQVLRRIISEGELSDPLCERIREIIDQKLFGLLSYNGMRSRSRKFLYEIKNMDSNDRIRSCNNYAKMKSEDFLQSQTCTSSTQIDEQIRNDIYRIKAECEMRSMTINGRKRICLQPMKIGSCKSTIPKYFFSSTQGECQQFIYSGCNANENNFYSMEECSTVCGIFFGDEGGQLLGKRDCRVTEWSEWSDCPAPCNEIGVIFRMRVFKSFPLNGGKECPIEMKQMKNCKKECKNHCTMSEWSTWSTCNKSCGNGSIQKRTRTVTSGINCDSTEEIRECHLPPCRRQKTKRKI